ncbi:unnamed protein product [Moneuplotes crassus]|uniref:AP2/ERF domain-containing protein n=1 Tax=Euplotes crassus TaxID=5936 RepID=A0AAD1XVE2_EUPCR|nr:unnamed protein product [Moneuplotes crassus]
MEMKMNCFLPSSTLLPAWDYLLMLQCLETTYCSCSSAEDSLQNINHNGNNGKKSPQKLETPRSSSSIKAYEKEQDSEWALKAKAVRIPNSLLDSHVSYIEKDIPEQQEKVKSAKIISKRRSRSTKLDIRKRLIRLKKRILAKNILEFSHSVRKTRGASDKYLGRRSQYIGVTKNTTNWQALINVKGAKKYIGTFVHEVEAAKAYDLYSVAMKGKKASCNFTYTGKEMTKMISYFLTHGSIKPLE